MKKGLAVKRLFQASPKSLLVNLCGWAALNGASYLRSDI